MPAPHLHVVGLQDDAALLAPELLQRQDQVLEGRRGTQAWRGLGKFPVCRLGGFLLHGLRLSGAAARALYANGGIGHLDFTGRARAAAGEAAAM